MMSPSTPTNGIWQPPAAASRPANVPARGLANEEPASRDHAWQREMERAQLATWFKATPSSLARPANSADLSNSDHARPGSPSRVYRTPLTPVTFSALSPHTTAASASSSMPEPRPSIAPHTLPAVNKADLPVVASEAFSKVAALTTDIARLTGTQVVTVNAPSLTEDGWVLPFPATTSAPTNTTTEQPPTLRLYAEWQGQSVCMWLGMDANKTDIPRRLDALIPQLRKCLSAHGARLTGLVCNGQSVLESSRPPLSTDF